MPTSARKSSLGAARRGPQKAHIPYRGDNPEVGKKTGIAVRHVERKSDGFEPFDELIEQADKRMPPKLKITKKRKQSVPLTEEAIDEYGEMSMELDDSPRQYFANSRQPVTPSSNRNGSSSRPVARTSDIDFDRIPSPRSRKSMGHTPGPGPSRLSNSFRAEDQSDDDDDEPSPRFDGKYDNQPGGSGEHDSPQGTSFMQMDQDDDKEPTGEEQEEPEEEVEKEAPPSKRDKGKGHTVLPDVPEERDSEIEDEIAQGLEDVREQTYSDDDGAAEAEPEPSPRQAKKAKFVEDPLKASRQKNGKVKKENRPHREGVRKSTREHYKPLDWWRGEKLVYGRNHGAGLVLVPPIKEIVRIPKEVPEALGKRKRSTRAKSKTADDIHYKIIPVDNPERGWDDKTNAYCHVIDYDSREEVERRIAFLAKQQKPKVVEHDGWSFMKACGDSDFIAAGMLLIPPGVIKPTKQSKDNTYMFYVVEGAVKLRVHNSHRVFATGAIFMVPRGNSYLMENISERETKIFFTQARKVVEDVPPSIAPPRRSSTGVGITAPLGRASSAIAQVESLGKSEAAAPKRAVSIR